jgi:translation initiation factor 5B
MESSDEDSSNTCKPLNKNRKGFNALAVDSDSDVEENRSQPVKGVKSHLSGKVKVGFALLELESGDSDSTKEDKSRDSEKEENVRNSRKKNAKVSQSVDLDDNINKKEEKSGKKGKKQRKKQRDDDDDEDIEKVLAELEMEYSGIKKVVVQEEPQRNEDISEESWKIDKKDKKKADTEKKESMAQESQEKPKEIVGGEEIEGTMKTAAQKKKEKKEKEKQKKMAQKKQVSSTYAFYLQ